MQLCTHIAKGLCDSNSRKGFFVFSGGWEVLRAVWKNRQTIRILEHFDYIILIILCGKAKGYGGTPV